MSNKSSLLIFPSFACKLKTYRKACCCAAFKEYQLPFFIIFIIILNLMDDEEQKTRARLTIIGTAFLKLGTGVMASWSSNNIYYLSYFRQQGYQITSNTNSLFILALLIPLSFSVLLATKLSNRFGYEKVIRICSIIFFTSPLVTTISFDMYVFLIFSAIVPASAFAIAAIPVFHSLWSHFPQQKNRVTALALFFFGCGQMLWGVVFVKIVNPYNQQASLHDEQENLVFFQGNITKNILLANRIILLICGLLFIIGAFLITKKHRVSEEESDMQLKLSQLVVKKQFLCIFFITTILSLYQAYLKTNAKLIYMPIIQDDYFITLLLTLTVASSILATIFWGVLGDRKGATFSFLFLVIVDTLFKIFMNFSHSKPTLIIGFILIGITQKGSIVLFGPALIEKYGLEEATQLLPFKAIALFSAFLLGPIFHLILSSVLTDLQILQILILLNIIAIVLSVKLFQTDSEADNEVEDL